MYDFIMNMYTGFKFVNDFYMTIRFHDGNDMMIYMMIIWSFIWQLYDGFYDDEMSWGHTIMVT